MSDLIKKKEKRQKTVLLCISNHLKAMGDVPRAVS